MGGRIVAGGRRVGGTRLGSGFDAPLELGAFAAYRGDVTDTASNFDWTDRTGHGHTLRQATADNKPTVVTPSEIGGASALRFDGTNDRLVGIDAAGNYTFLHNGAGMFFEAVIIPRTALVANDAIMSTYAGGASFCLVFGTTATQARNIYFNNAAGVTADAVAAGGFAIDTPVRITGSYKESASPEWDIRVNNVSISSGSSATAPGSNAAAAALNVGTHANGTAPGEFDIAELVIFDRVLTSLERDFLDAHLVARYGFSV